VRGQLDGLSASDVIWAPYDSHRLSQPYEPISLFRDFIRLGNTIQMHVPCAATVWLHADYAPPPLVVDNAAFQMVNVQWANFPDFVLTNVILVVEPHACIDDYMEWFRRVSHTIAIQVNQSSARLTYVVFV